MLRTGICSRLLVRLLVRFLVWSFARRLVLSFILPAALVLALGPGRLQAAARYAPLAHDCLSTGSGAWSDPATWTGCDGGTPQADDNVYLQAGHTVQLAADTAVNDLNLSSGTDATATTGGAKLALGSYVLDLHGKLRSYWGAVGAIPGTDSTNVKPDAITITAGSTGRIRVVGASRTLTTSNEWGALPGVTSPANFALEIAPDPQAVIRLEGLICASRWTLTSGTLDTTQRLLVDRGALNAGDITVGPAATLISEVTGSTAIASRLNGLSGGTFTVDGRLIVTSSTTRVYMLTTAFNNVVEYSGTSNQTLAVKATGGSGVYQYNHLVLAGAGVKTLADNTTVRGSLTRKGTATLSLGSPAAKTLTYGTDAEIVYAGTSLQTTGPELPGAAVGIGGLRVENTAGVKLGQGLLVKARLTLGGDLDTGTYTLKLGPQAACAGTGDVLGTVLRPDPPVAGSYCLGNPNLQIVLPPGTTMPTSLGAVLAVGTAPFDGAVLRRYTITAPGFAGVAILRLPYDGEDLNGNEGARLHLWHLTGDTWALQAATARGVDALGKPYVESSGVGAFSDWALADGGAPAAVTVLGLAVEVVDGRVRLHWQTASELDCGGFVIRRSRAPDARGEQVAEVAARAPGSPAGASYTWEDPEGLGQPPGAFYYWLDVVDEAAGIVPQPVPAVARFPGVYLAEIGR